MCTLEQTHRHKTKYSYEVAALDLSSSGRDVRCHRCMISGKHIKQVELFKLEKRKSGFAISCICFKIKVQSFLHQIKAVQ